MPLDFATSAAAAVIGSTVRDAAEPVITFVGGAAAVGSAILCVREWAKDDPQWDRAMGHGAVLGALVGAGLLAIDAVS